MHRRCCSSLSMTHGKLLLSFLLLGKSCSAGRTLKSSYRFPSRSYWLFMPVILHIPNDYSCLLSFTFLVSWTLPLVMGKALAASSTGLIICTQSIWLSDKTPLGWLIHWLNVTEVPNGGRDWDTFLVLPSLGGLGPPLISAPCCLLHYL